MKDLSNVGLLSGVGIKPCSGYQLNVFGHDGLRRVCRCHWMKPVVPAYAYVKGWPRHRPQIAAGALASAR